MHEVAAFLREQGALLEDGPSLAAFWGAPQDAEEESMRRTRSRVPAQHGAAAK